MNARFLLAILIVIVFSGCDEIGKYQDGIALIKDFRSKKYGYVDENKNHVIPVQYDLARDFDKGFAIVGIKNKKGVINRTGKEVIPIVYDEIYRLSEDYFRVKENSKYGLLHHTGEEIIPTVADGIGRIHENKYVEVEFGKENKMALYDLKGKKLTDAAYDNVYLIQYGLAIMRTKTNDHSFYSHGEDKYSYKIYDLFNPNNALNKIHSTGYISILNENTIKRDTYIVMRTKYSSGLTSVVNGLGETIFPEKKFYEVTGYGEGLFVVRTKFYNNGYVDINGNLILKPVFRSAEPFKKGSAKVEIEDKSFYIDKNGNCVQDCPTDKWLEHYQIGNFKVDRKFYDRLIRQGIREAQSGDYHKSINTFDKATDEDPTDFESYYNKALSLLLLHKLDEAIRVADEAIELNPNHANSFYVRGSAFLEKNGYYSAISDFEKAIKINPNVVDYHLSMAVAYGKKGDRKEACRYFLNACRLGDQDACNGYREYCSFSF